MSVLVATAYMDEAERFDWLVAMDDGRVMATGRPQDIKSHTGTDSLDTAFIQLLPEHKRRGHQRLVVPPRSLQRQGLPAIQATGLSKQFADFTAVDHVSFEIERGEIFGFLGSNGCGKTTTMKMLTGLLPASSGEARLFGRPVDPHDLETRKRVGYMSQSFSLYGELTVKQNLDLHARLFHLPPERIATRLARLIEQFGLENYVDELSAGLPLGIRQRLSLAVAVVHEPEMLILDEPTSGVDPVARDQFWELLVDLSRNQGVTIFISTHFMSEAERCDRISFMHAGKVLASDTPRALIDSRDAGTLEEAFISYLQVATGKDTQPGSIPEETSPDASATEKTPPTGAFSLMRLLGYSRREGMELLRDPVRLAFALLGPLILMVVFGYGISFDVQDLSYAVLDYDQSAESRSYLENFSGSRYFSQRPVIRDHADMEMRLRGGELAVAIEIPPGFGKDLRRGRPLEVGVWLDGAVPFRAETSRGYVQGLHLEKAGFVGRHRRARIAVAAERTLHHLPPAPLSMGTVGWCIAGAPLSVCCGVGESAQDRLMMAANRLTSSALAITNISSPSPMTWFPRGMENSPLARLYTATKTHSAGKSGLAVRSLTLLPATPAPGGILTEKMSARPPPMAVTLRNSGCSTSMTIWLTIRSVTRTRLSTPASRKAFS